MLRDIALALPCLLASFNPTNEHSPDDTLSGEMLAAHHDQENLVQSHPMAGKAGSRQLAPKTPGPRYPKTPMKIPLNDENAPVTGGKALLGGGKGSMTKKQMLATPLGECNAADGIVWPRDQASLTGSSKGTRPRAPLGNKTTNAKARAAPATGGVKDKVKEIEQSQSKPTTVQKPKHKQPGTAPAKLEVRIDEEETGEPDIEYVPPRPKDLPYESDVFPDDLLTFEGLKPENLLRGYYERYHDPVDENGVRLKERKFEERLQKALKEGDERILRDVEDIGWPASDVIETKQPPKEQQKRLVRGTGAKSSQAVNRTASTLASKRAASTLSMAPTVRERKPRLPVQTRKPRSFLPGRQASKPMAPTKSQPESVVAEVASRNTLGYSKGRSTSSAMQTRRPLTRAPSAASVSSNHSDVTITPANFHKTQEPKPQFLRIFEADDDSDDDGFGKTADVNFDDDEDFQLKLDE